MSVEWVQSPSSPMVVAGKKLEYACWGPSPETAPTLVMLHEGLGSVGLWRDVPEMLAQSTGMGVLAFSRAGYGGSDPAELPRPLDYMTREAETVLGNVLDQAGIGSCILLGHSDGATIASIYAGSVSDMRVRGLILIAPHFFAEKEGLKAIAAARARFDQGALREKLARHHANPENAFNGWCDAWLDPGFRDWNVAEVIDHWRIPVLAIQGRDDPYGSLDQIKEIEDRIYSPLETCVLDGCAHAPHLECSEQTLASIKAFCATLHRMEREEVSLA